MRKTLRRHRGDPHGARRRWGIENQDHPPSTETITQESGLRENRTSRLSERTEEGRQPDLLRLYHQPRECAASRSSTVHCASGTVAVTRLPAGPASISRLPWSCSRRTRMPDTPTPRPCSASLFVDRGRNPEPPSVTSNWTASSLRWIAIRAQLLPECRCTFA